MTHKAWTVALGQKNRQIQVRSVDMETPSNPNVFSFLSRMKTGGKFRWGILWQRFAHERTWLWESFLKGKREDSIIFLWGVSVTECTMIFSLFTKQWTLSGFNTFSESRKNKNPKLPSFDAHSWALPRWHAASLAPMLKTSQTRYKTQTQAFAHPRGGKPCTVQAWLAKWKERRKKGKRKKLK